MAKGGGVQVVVRVRPMVPREIEFDNAVEAVSAKEIVVFKRDQEFASQYDSVLPEQTSQEQVYETLKDGIMSAIAGYNNTVFAYGQTGTGKTHTMMGNHGVDITDTSDPATQKSFGIIPRAVRELFTEAKQLQVRDGSVVSIAASYMEIYNDRLFDLLQPYKKRGGRDPLDVRKQKEMLEVREDPQGATHVPNLLNVKVKSYQSVLQLISKGNKNRAVRHTEMNMSSSRSHAILQLVLEQWPGGGKEGRLVRSKLNFVDLAGSERWSHKSEMQSEHVSELTAINSSLSTLASVVSALTEGAKHVPYRDSKLTHLLQDSLGGNCRTTIIATISPSADAFDESCSTLKFADRVSNLSNNPVVNTTRDMASVLALKEKEIQRLRQMLANVAANGGEVGLPQGDLQVAPELQEELESTRRALEMERAIRTELEMKLQRASTASGIPPLGGSLGSTGSARGGAVAEGGEALDTALDGERQGTAFDSAGMPGTPGGSAPWGQANQSRPSSSGSRSKSKSLQGSEENGASTTTSYNYFKVDTPPPSSTAQSSSTPAAGEAPHSGSPDLFWASRNRRGLNSGVSQSTAAVERSGGGASSSGRGGRMPSPSSRRPAPGSTGSRGSVNHSVERARPGDSQPSSLESAIQQLRSQVQQLSILENVTAQQQARISSSPQGPPRSVDKRLASSPYNVAQSRSQSRSQSRDRLSSSSSRALRPQEVNPSTETTGARLADSNAVDDETNDSLADSGAVNNDELDPELVALQQLHQLRQQKVQMMQERGQARAKIENDSSYAAVVPPPAQRWGRSAILASIDASIRPPASSPADVGAGRGGGSDEEESASNSPCISPTVPTAHRSRSQQPIPMQALSDGEMPSDSAPPTAPPAVGGGWGRSALLGGAPPQTAEPSAGGWGRSALINPAASLPPPSQKQQLVDDLLHNGRGGNSCRSMRPPPPKKLQPSRRSVSQPRARTAKDANPMAMDKGSMIYIMGAHSSSILSKSMSKALLANSVCRMD